MTTEEKLAKPGACKDCGASPCDCGEPIWDYWYRFNGIDAPRWEHHGTGRCRQEMVESANRMRDRGRHTPGPVQRITDPPYEFPAAKPAEKAAPAVAVSAKKPTCVLALAPGRDTQSQLAYAIFGAVASGVDLRPLLTLHAEFTRAAEPNADKARRERVLDVMWEGKDGKGGTMPEARKAAEALAAVFLGKVKP